MSSYQVLARKWRPQALTDVVGQQHVLAAITNGLLLGRIHHAWLFSGTRGVGKTSIARLLTKCLNCEIGITATPCGICNNCREIEQGRLVDFIEIDAASRTKVEDTRDLLDNVYYAPVRSRFKIYLIDEVHMLSRYSFNALLKIIEEPPMHVKFLFATTDPQKIPITVLSRCLHFRLKTLEDDQIKSHLEHILIEEKINYDTRSLQLLARAAEGSLRDALNLTDQAIASGSGKLTAEIVSTMLGLLDEDQALSLIEAIVEANGERVMTLINNVASHGIEWEALLVKMQSLLHRIAMAQLLPSTFSMDINNLERRMRTLIRTVSPADIQLYYQILIIGRKELPFAPDRRMGVEMTMLRALAFHPKTSLQEEIQSNSKTCITKNNHITTSIPSSQILQKNTPLAQKAPLSKTTHQVLVARKQLQKIKEETQYKQEKSKSLDKIKHLTKNSLFERMASVGEQIHKKDIQSVVSENLLINKEKDNFRYTATTCNKSTKEEVLTSTELKKNTKI